MPIRQIQAPDGDIREIEVPDGATDAQIQQFIDGEVAAGRLSAGPQKRKPGLGASFRRGVSGALSDFTTAGEGTMGDANKAALSGIARSKQLEEENPSQ